MKIKGLFFAFLVSGCATGYYAQDFSGGYSEFRINPDSFMVTFKGNGYTPTQRVFQYVLLRASELTLQNGYRYFIVVSSMDQTSSYNYSNTYGDTSGSAEAYNTSNYTTAQFKGVTSSSTYSGRMVKPGTSINIKCFKENPGLDGAIDAQFYWDANSQE